MENVETINTIRFKLKRYKDELASLREYKSDLELYKRELKEKLVDLSIYDDMQKDIEDKIASITLVAMTISVGLGLAFREHRIDNNTLLSIITNPKLYAAITALEAVPLMFSDKVARFAILRKHGYEISKADEKNIENSEEIDFVSTGIRYAENDISRVMSEISKLNNAIEVVKEVESDDFLEIEQSKVKQLMK